jgi:hypothetical protein
MNASKESSTPSNTVEHEILARINSELGIGDLKVVSNDEFMATLDEDDGIKISYSSDGKTEIVSNDEIRTLINKK